MRINIKKIWLKGFRNLTETVLEWTPPKATLILGENNQGKTNLLDALAFLLTGQSTQTTNLEDIIAIDQDEFTLVADLESKNTPTRLSIRYRRGGEMVVLRDQQLCTSFRSIKQEFPTVFISSDIVYAFKDSPQIRRQNIDRFCENYDPEFTAIKRQYDRLLKQKNSVLKDDNPTPETLQFWNQQLVPIATKIVEHRIQALHHIQTHYQTLVSNGNPLFDQPLDIHYAALGENKLDPTTYAEKLTQKYEEIMDKEIASGHNLAGPGRDDYTLILGGQNLFIYFSRGINKAVAFLLTLAQWEALYHKLGAYPLLLLDDTFAEIDVRHKTWLCSLLTHKGQLIYTSVLPEDKLLFPDATHYHMIQGHLHHG